jgi:hypothetical protein
MKISDYQVIGFSGSRLVVPSALYQLLDKITDQQIIVGDCRGVDQAVRDYLKHCQVICTTFKGKGATAERSIRFVKEIASNRGCLVSFPSSDVPKALTPTEKSNKAFCGTGSGTWATLAYAVGLNLPCFVYLQNYSCNWLDRINPEWAIHQPVTFKYLF